MYLYSVVVVVVECRCGDVVTYSELQRRPRRQPQHHQLQAHFGRLQLQPAWSAALPAALRRPGGLLLVALPPLRPQYARRRPCPARRGCALSPGRPRPLAPGPRPPSTSPRCSACGYTYGNAGWELWQCEAAAQKPTCSGVAAGSRGAAAASSWLQPWMAAQTPVSETTMLARAGSRTAYAVRTWGSAFEPAWDVTRFPSALLGGYIYQSAACCIYIHIFHMDNTTNERPGWLHLGREEQPACGHGLTGRDGKFGSQCTFTVDRLRTVHG